MRGSPIIVALDVPSSDKALALAEELMPIVSAFKIGSELFTTAGPDVVRQINRLGATVFLDLKFHDIPNTVAKAVTAATRLGAHMVTVHTSGGLAMMQAAETAARQTAEQLRFKTPMVLGVTVLTSLDGSALSEAGQDADPGRQVDRLAKLALKAGLRGLVCSPLEVESLRRVLPRDVQLVVPGIRAAGAQTSDQKRTLSAAEALKAGADWLVIGRPIYAAEDPVLAAKKIVGSIE